LAAVGGAALGALGALSEIENGASRLLVVMPLTMTIASPFDSAGRGFS